jgi:hypothetical protein
MRPPERDVRAVRRRSRVGLVGFWRVVAPLRERARILREAAPVGGTARLVMPSESLIGAGPRRSRFPGCGICDRGRDQTALRPSASANWASGRHPRRPELPSRSPRSDAAHVLFVLGDPAALSASGRRRRGTRARHGSWTGRRRALATNLAAVVRASCRARGRYRWRGPPLVHAAAAPSRSSGRAIAHPRALASLPPGRHRVGRSSELGPDVEPSKGTFPRRNRPSAARPATSS